MPSGSSGRLRKPAPRSLKATEPSSAKPSAKAALTNASNPALSSSEPARELLKNAEVRAFCTETSKPKNGASGVLKYPKTTPSASTTATLTCAKLPRGWRMAARVTTACSIAWEMIRSTSCAVSPSRDALSRNGNRFRPCASTAMRPGTPSRAASAKPNAASGVSRITLSKKNWESAGMPTSISCPGKSSNARAGGGGGISTLTNGSRMPSSKIVSPRILAGASKPREPATAMRSSMG